MDADQHRPRRPRADGERRRRAILLAAAELATVEGLDGLTISRLAHHVGMSKSGLFAHFRSKEQLELATIETASAIFHEEVVQPGLGGPAGAARLERLADAYLSHVERRVFPGGCFFASAAAELDTRPGAVRERIADVYEGWLALIERLVEEAKSSGELDTSVDAAQLAFEINALLLGANASFVLHGRPTAIERARTAIRARLARESP